MVELTQRNDFRYLVIQVTRVSSKQIIKFDPIRVHSFLMEDDEVLVAEDKAFYKIGNLAFVCQI